MSVGDKMRLFKDLYQYRELLKTNVKKEIRGKYKGSFLGVLWSFINPLLQVLVYAIVFPFIMRSSPDHFIVYLVIGIIPWNFFINAVFIGMTNFIMLKPARKPAAMAQIGEGEHPVYAEPDLIPIQHAAVRHDTVGFMQM